LIGITAIEILTERKEQEAKPTKVQRFLFGAFSKKEVR
jgi:hypothetical protein